MHLPGLSALASTGLALAAITPLTPRDANQHVIGSVPETSSFACDLPPVAVSPEDGFPSAREVFGTKEGLLKQVKRHTAVVNVPSVCFDDLGDFDEDPRWAPFYVLHDVLEDQYPIL